MHAAPHSTNQRRKSKKSHAYHLTPASQIMMLVWEWDQGTETLITLIRDGYLTSRVLIVTVALQIIVISMYCQ